MKAVVAAFNQEKVLVGAFSVITNLRMELFGALRTSRYIVICLQDGGGQDAAPVPQPVVPHPAEADQSAGLRPGAGKRRHSDTHPAK